MAELETADLCEPTDPSVVVATQNTQKPLIRILNMPRLVFDPVYLNGIHALRRFEIKNQSLYPLNIKLRSNLGSQISFQLTNENLPDEELNDYEKPVFKLGSWSNVTSSVRSSTNSNSEPNSPPDEARFSSISQSSSVYQHAPASSEKAQHQFNQLFNYVNPIEQVFIAPGENEKIIVCFLPEERKHAGKDPLGDEPFTDEESNDFFDVNGVIFFFAFKTTPGENKGTKSDKDENSVILKHPLVFKVSAECDFEGINANSAAPDYQVAIC